MDLRETGLKPLNDFRLKAGLRREGSPTQTSPSEYRLQPEASEGLQARVVGISKVLAAPNTPVGTEPDPPALSQPAVILAQQFSIGGKRLTAPLQTRKIAANAFVVCP